jgi:hypothetical protein
MARMDEVRIGDMARYDGGWYLVKRLCPLTRDVLIRINDDQNEWVPVAELSGIERRPVR